MKQGRTAQRVEENKARTGKAENSKGSAKKRTLPKACEPYKFKPGQSGNPGGRPKNDLAKELAQAVFTNNSELIYKAMVKMLSKGNAYAFDVYANRAFGKVSDKLEVTGGDELMAKLLAGRKRAAERK